MRQMGAWLLRPAVGAGPFRARHPGHEGDERPIQVGFGVLGQSLVLIDVTDRAGVAASAPAPST